ncbi:RNA polymerase sigma factor [Nocardia sp. XZ_19_385]|uniref:RNA polymerase sigma factor n=1 Tax=Nocardia sp. XZ_19_385 TaxID=2769488 RepID=UPI00189023B6|nr:sigma-70 family RNA polymerase sigma factor [Nocardia sp. XZ_19_385]
MTDIPDDRLTKARRRCDAIFRSHSRAVFKIARRSLDHEGASDVVQEVFTAVWVQYERDFDKVSDESLIRIVMTIATRRAADHVRKLGHGFLPMNEYTSDQILIFMSHGITDPLDKVLNQQDYEHFCEVLLNELTDREYQAVMMTHVLGFDDREIGELMGVSEGTVRSHRSRARVKVHYIVQRGGHLHSDSARRHEQSSHRRKGSGGESTA